jgi:hypothetical protein
MERVMAILSKQQMDAAREFANATISALKSAEEVHAATVVAATARMAGTYLFRSFDLRLAGVKPGQVVLSEEANEQGTVLFQITFGILARIGIKIAGAPSGKAAEPRHKLQLGFLETQTKLEPLYAPIKTRFGLSLPEAAQAAAVATALLIRHCTKVLDPDVAFGIAAYGFVEGMKTAPEPVENTGGA